jgi:hypothetical protein
MTLSRTSHSKKGFRPAKVTSRASEVVAPTRVEVDRLLGQMRDANERLVIAAIHAQDVSDEARADATQARAELDGLMGELEDANRRLSAAAAEAQAMAE